eukprot:746332-Hanusia_phi.AAC.11
MLATRTTFSRPDRFAPPPRAVCLFLDLRSLQLLPENFKAACDLVGQNCSLRMQPGYDHRPRQVSQAEAFKLNKPSDIVSVRRYGLSLSLGVRQGCNDLFKHSLGSPLAHEPRCRCIQSPASASRQPAPSSRCRSLSSN